MHNLVLQSTNQLFIANYIIRLSKIYVTYLLRSKRGMLSRASSMFSLMTASERRDESQLLTHVHHNQCSLTSDYVQRIAELQMGLRRGGYAFVEEFKMVSRWSGG